MSKRLLTARSFAAAITTQKGITLALLTLLLVALPFSAMAQFVDWTQANTDGFGSTNNSAAPAMAVFDGYLYVGTFNSSTGGEVWRSNDGTTWTQANTGGFSDANNIGAYPRVVFGSYLYAGTYNNSGAGGEVWRTSDGTTWTQANTNGFGDTSNGGTYPYVVFDGYLYAGTTGGEVWRSNDGTTWTQANTDRFGDVNNTGTYPKAVFGSYLYAGTYNSSTGGEVWRSDDGTTWTQVNTDGFGDANNRSADTMAVFDGYLYVSTVNLVTGGEVWRSDDGTTWTQVNTDGFGDMNNTQIPSLAVFDSYLYTGTYNSSAGSEVWRTSNGTSWTQVNANGFGDANNGSAYPTAVFDNNLYTGTSNYSTGGEVWRTRGIPTTTHDYGWENGATILGSDGNLVNALNVTSGTDPYGNPDPVTVTPHGGSAMLQVTEAPHSGTPQGYVAFVENLANGDQVTASFWGWDITASGSPSLRIWGHWALSGDVNSYVASASGNPDYTDGSGWSQLAWTWTLDTTAYPAADALVIEARLYSTPSSGDYSTDYWIDDLQVTAPDTAVVSFPEPTAIELASFTATPQASAILLQWETATELDNLGFNLYRANMPDGLRTQLNASLIPAQNPGSPVGATYTFLDEGVQPGLTYHYWLEDVDVYGVGTLHGPVAAIAPGQPHLLRPRPAIVPWSPPPKE